MSAELVRALDADVRRLLAAGASVAARDAGLRRRARALRELVGRAPALGPLSDRLDRVTAGRSDGAPALLDLLVMMGQVRAGLAGAGATGAMESVPESGPWSTPVAAADLARPVRWLRRPSWEDPWKDTRFFLMRRPDLRLVGPLLDRLTDRDAEVAKCVAKNFLPQYGPTAVPELRLLLERTDPRAQSWPLAAICHIDGRLGAELCRPRLSDPDLKVRRHALHCLAAAAPDEARRTALAWLEGRPSAPVRAAAWGCLKELGPARAADLPALLAGLAKGRDCGATEVVASVGRAAVRPLAQMLRSPDRTARIAAAVALGHLGPKAVGAVSQLIDLLADPDEVVATSGLWALAQIGGAARAAVPRLIELVAAHDSECGIGFSAADALAKVGRDDPAAVAALVARLDSKRSDVVFNAISRLAEVGPAARAAVPRLVALYRGRRAHWQLRRHILECLAGLGTAAAAARPLLEKALGDREIRVRYAAALALGMIGPAGRAAVPVLIEAMHDSRESWWWSMHGEQALRALGAIGPAAGAAVPDLIEAARAEFSPRRRRAAREALARIRGTR